MLVELIEILEIEKPYINHKFLMNEIAKFRETEGITEKFLEEAIIKFKQILLEKLEKHNNL